MMDVREVRPANVTGLLVSQIGYEAELSKRALIRSTDSDYACDARFEVRDAYNGRIYFSAEVVRWGERWGSTWWTMDFTGLYRSGLYRLHLLRGNEEYAFSDPFRVGVNIVWDSAVETVAFAQFDERARHARHGAGWRDCGAHGRECDSHTYAIIGLCDLLQHGFAFLPPEKQCRLAGVIVTGCDYLCLLMDWAEQAGHPPGAVAHELPFHGEVIPGNVVATAMALGYASRLLFDIDQEKASLYASRAAQAFGYFLGMSPYSMEGFSAINRGIEEGYQPHGFMTRDLLMALWAGLQLYAAGRLGFKPELERLTQSILDRQIVQADAEHGYWGHFYEFDDRHHSEKANTHHHIGHDTGAILAWNMLPLMEFNQWFGESALASRARQAVCDFAAHFALPACRANPFLLLPMGVFGQEGLLDLCGPWHGMNATYGYFASMAVRLSSFAGLPELIDTAVGNIQWICGLNAGVTKESMNGCVVWRETIPEGIALPYSQIVGVGHRSVGGWAGIPGSIINGFCTNPQFTLQVKPNRDNDGPWFLTDEDWIPHAGGFLSAVAVLRSHFSVPWNL